MIIIMTMIIMIIIIITNKLIIIIFFYEDMIAYTHNNTKLDPTVTELFIRSKKVNISLFVAQSYFSVSKILT